MPNQYSTTSCIFISFKSEWNGWCCNKSADRRAGNYFQTAAQKEPPGTPYARPEHNKQFLQLIRFTRCLKQIDANSNDTCRTDPKL